MHPLGYVAFALPVACVDRRTHSTFSYFELHSSFARPIFEWYAIHTKGSRVLTSTDIAIHEDEEHNIAIKFLSKSFLLPRVSFENCTYFLTVIHLPSSFHRRRRPAPPLRRLPKRWERHQGNIRWKAYRITRDVRYSVSCFLSFARSLTPLLRSWDTSIPEKTIKEQFRVLKYLAQSLLRFLTFGPHRR